MKSDFRKKVQSSLKRLNVEDKACKFQKIYLQLDQLLEQRKFPEALLIGIYDACGWEVPLDSYFSKFPSYSLAYPRPIVNKENAMEFIKANVDELFSVQSWGGKIRAPIQSSSQNIVIPDLLFVPGLAFSKSGHRLGRGAGCYDRYLSNYNGISVGLGIEEQIFDQVPTEGHDLSVQYVVSENFQFKTNFKGESG